MSASKRWWAVGGRRAGPRRAPTAPAAEIVAMDTYEWLPGGFAFLHIVDARVGGQKVEGAEIIGWDPSRASYITQYFGSDGATAYEATLGEEGRPSRGRCAARPPDSPAA
jgi:hypothetical protein